ncbi:hypothetical protein HZA85_01570 [Candidatus Uhrbacteria bacterium]|nr:hypothetical protein [Candidatus Uhrbacteria bacterium]
MFELPQFSLPLSIFLYVYSAYMLFYVLYSLFNIYHLIRYGVYGFGLYLIVTLFTGGTILLVGGSLYLLLGYDWTQIVSLNALFEKNAGGIFPGL